MSNEELIAFIKKNPIGIGCGVLSIALLGGWYYRMDDVPAAETEVQEKSDEAQRLETNVSYSSQLKEQYDAIMAAGKEIDVRIVRANELGKNNQYFYKLESDTGVKLDLRQAPFNPRKEAKPVAYVPIGFSVTAIGNLNQLMAFLRHLEGGTHYCRILGATLSTQGERGGNMTLSLSIELLGFPPQT